MKKLFAAFLVAVILLGGDLIRRSWAQFCAGLYAYASAEVGRNPGDDDGRPDLSSPKLLARASPQLVVQSDLFKRKQASLWRSVVCE